MLMIAMALQFFGLRRDCIASPPASAPAPCRVMRSLLTAPDMPPRSRLAYSTASCLVRLVYAFAAQPRARPEALPGFLTMAAFD